MTRLLALVVALVVSCQRDVTPEPTPATIGTALRIVMQHAARRRVDCGPAYAPSGNTSSFQVMPDAPLPRPDLWQACLDRADQVPCTGIDQWLFRGECQDALGVRP